MVLRRGGARFHNSPHGIHGMLVKRQFTNDSLELLPLFGRPGRHARADSRLAFPKCLASLLGCLRVAYVAVQALAVLNGLEESPSVAPHRRDDRS